MRNIHVGSLSYPIGSMRTRDSLSGSTPNFLLMKVVRCDSLNIKSTLIDGFTFYVISGELQVEQSKAEQDIINLKTTLKNFISLQESTQQLLRVRHSQATTNE